MTRNEHAPEGTPQLRQRRQAPRRETGQLNCPDPASRTLKKCRKGTKMQDYYDRTHSRLQISYLTYMFGWLLKQIREQIPAKTAKKFADYIQDIFQLARTSDELKLARTHVANLRMVYVYDTHTTWYILSQPRNWQRSQTDLHLLALFNRLLKVARVHALGVLNVFIVRFLPAL